MKLTRAEEQVMQAIWKLEKAYLGEILEELSSLQLQRTTIATVLKVLAEKEFVGIHVNGRSHQYYPLISKERYSMETIEVMVNRYFDGSFRNIFSFLMKEKKLSVRDLEQALQQIRDLKSKK